MREYKERTPDAWTFERAWKNRARLAREEREGSIRSAARGTGGVSGQFQVPVFAVRFANTPAEPWPTQELEEALFGWTRNSLSDYYLEVSGNRVEVYGSVRGWHELPEIDRWYEGTSSGTNPYNARVGELIGHTLQAQDAEVDFGLYDNDGPDGVPNSGDDDGYVDFVAFVHPETGAECGGAAPSIWSHRWRYSAWSSSGGVPFVTGDASASGGQILIDDYTIQPALACDGESRVEIGVFCHEFGHAFGLPDLYDTDGGSAGLGHWCLMASGNWNDPDSPAHMSAWAKAQLGWVEVIDADWRGTQVDIGPVAQTGQVYRLTTREDRWRRRDDCALSGDYSLGVGLDDEESAARGWRTASGYGNGWVETAVREFSYAGEGLVRLDFDYRVQTEAGFDFVFLFVEQNGREITLAIYDGDSSGHASYGIEHLLSAGPYRVGFRLRTDIGWSNEDGKFSADCTAFSLDEVRVTGGGMQYSEDFEHNRGGWFQPRTARDNPLNEYWLVENRQVQGFDQALHGQGLVVYHVDEDVAGSSLQNTGGSTGESTRGIVIEEADGRFDLLASPGNRGDAGDVWSTSGEAQLFDLTSTPGTADNAGRLTQARIEVLSESGGTIQARLWGGDERPVLSGAETDTLTDGMTSLTLVGSGLQPGLSVELIRIGAPAIPASRVDWIDYDLVVVEFDGSEVRSGAFDLVVENPDGQTWVRESGIFRSGEPVGTPANLPPRARLAQNYPNPFNPRTAIRFEIPVATNAALVIFDARGRRIATLHEGPVEAGYHTEIWEGRDEHGQAVASGLYFARLSGPGFAETRKMMLAR